MVRNKLTQSQATKVVTAQIFLILYFACTVWLTPSLNGSLKRTIDSLHFRALRLILRDYRQRVSRIEITQSTNRLPPDKWSKFAVASLFVNMFASNQPKALLENIKSNSYTKGRKPGLLFSFDSSVTKISRQASKNWVGQALSAISSPWLLVFIPTCSSI